jgi:hypothetical protein
LDLLSPVDFAPSMNARHWHKTWLARLVGGLLALLASGLVGLPMARANCGDYVVVGGSVMTEHKDIAHTTAPSPVRAPCHGPMCSQAPSPLPLPSTPVGTTGAEQWLWCEAFPELCPHALAPYFAFFQRFLPLHSTSPLERPPRAAV